LKVVSIPYYRCYSALGDIAKARYMKETFRIAEEVAKNTVSVLKF